MADTLATVTALARAIANDDTGSVYSDTVLLPFVNARYRSLQRKLAEVGVRSLSDTTDLNLSTGATSITTSTTPALPSDFLQPWKLREKVTGSADKFVDMYPVVGTLPDYDQGTLNRLWEWRAGQIRLIGATGPVTVRLEYERLFPDLTAPTDPLLINGAVDPVAYGAAADVARSRGASEAARDWNAIAAEETRAYLNRMTHGMQFVPFRRRAYSRFRTFLP